MDQQIEHLEQAMDKLSTSQSDLMNRMNEMFDKLDARMDRMSVQPAKEVGENSQLPTRVSIGQNDFELAVFIRYGPNPFSDFFGDLAKLQQVGSWVASSIRTDIQDARLNSLSIAIRDTASNGASIPVRRLSQAELQERCNKGLCYNYNEKFVPGHRCKKLFVIESCYDEEDGDIIMNEDDTIHEGLSELPEISLHAISGSRAPETMWIKGGIGYVTTIILVDSGSIHNFISETFASKVGLQPE
ncbi:hypothetical protein IFM89_023859 [Coptis chinensis]|uniref:Uncharacterized protein n=1 Tax=Coptis chinensis TaxID=261450 RepID=A0A835M1H6_9MAGN|nr:hypothetical protein IFM89_023859 [Coptis chinensis]